MGLDIFFVVHSESSHFSGLILDHRRRHYKAKENVVGRLAGGSVYGRIYCLSQRCGMSCGMLYGRGSLGGETAFIVDTRFRT